MGGVAVMKRVHSWQPICSVEPWVRHPNPEKAWRQTRGAEVNCCAPAHPASPELHRGRSFEIRAEDWNHAWTQPSPDGRWRAPGRGRLALFNDDEEPRVHEPRLDVLDLENEPDEEPRPRTVARQRRVLDECVDPEDVPHVVVVPCRQPARALRTSSSGPPTQVAQNVTHQTQTGRRQSSMLKSSQCGRPRVSEDSEYIHVRLPSELCHQLKRRATAEHRTLRSVIVDLLRAAVDSRRAVTDSHEAVRAADHVHDAASIRANR